MKEIVLIAAFFIAVVLSNSYAQHSKIQSLQHFYNFKELDTNNIGLRVDNIGSLRDIRGFWDLMAPHSVDYMIFNHGPWIVGNINGEPVTSLVQWYSTYSPGPIIN